MLGEVEGRFEGCLLGALLGVLMGPREGSVLGDALGEREGCLLGEFMLEQPAVSATSATTASLHAPPTSRSATQKKAPPLHANSPLLYSLRSDMT